MFNLNDDPYEQVNKAHNNKFRAERQKLIARLKQWVSDTGRQVPRAGGLKSRLLRTLSHRTEQPGRHFQF